MKEIILALTMLIILATVPAAQVRPCHVYVVDVIGAKKALEKILDEGETPQNMKAAEKTQTLYPEFQPDYSEERLTTKTFPFPDSKLIVTASVMSTDESMASAKGRDSLLLGIVVGTAGQQNALTAEDNAVTEITFDDNTDTARVKRYLKVNGKLFLVGLECHIKERRPNK